MSVTTLDELAKQFPVDIGPLEPVVVRYPMRITRYYLSLIQKPCDPIWLQCVPHRRELEDDAYSHFYLGNKAKAAWGIEVGCGCWHRKWGLPANCWVGRGARKDPLPGSAGLRGVAGCDRRCADP